MYMTMAVHAGGDGAPQSQVCRICWTWLALDLWTVTHVICWNRLAIGLRRCNAGSGCLLDVVGWDLWGWTRWSRRNERPIFGDCEIVWGDGLAMGDLPWLWENGRPMGICQNVWGDASGVWLYGGAAKPYGEMACVGGRRIAWGSRENVWEMPRMGYGKRRQHMGRPPGRMGSQKSHQNRNYWNGGRLVDFADCNEFLVGGGGPAFATVKASHRACCECRGA